MNQTNNVKSSKKNYLIFILVAVIFSMIYVIPGVILYKLTYRPEVKLNDRQIAILKKEGLPTKYSDLTETQQDAIVSIEKMLEYADKKYKTTFEYLGYSAPSTLYAEHMVAYPSFGVQDRDSFTITSTDKGYTDDYGNVLANNILQPYLNNELSKLNRNYKCYAFLTVTSTSFTTINPSIDDLSGKAYAKMIVYIYNAASSDSFLSEFENDLKAIMKVHAINGSADIVVLKENILSKINVFNYTDYLSTDYYSNRYTYNF